MANTKISALTANTNPSGSEEMVYALSGTNGKMSLDTMKTFVQNNLTWYATTADLATKQDTLVSWTNIRTINGTSILWSWNITIQWGWWQTQYDYSAMQWPCSTWYHIPSQWEWQSLYNAWITMSAWTSSWIIEWITYLKMPTTWVRTYSNASASQQTSQWRYWTYVPDQTENAYLMYFGGGSFNFAQSTHRANAVMIRPFKDTPVIPDITWTTLYDWSWTAAWAWIFYNSWLWLISISADWETWITIADKNLWATVVYNYLDTLDATNVWTYFQWWNNYWFAYTWTPTTSWTQVDASTYWPWNYYSSSTFITWHNDWSSVQNDNLWWYITWPTPITSWWITELTADANIWELEEWFYTTTYDLYYMSGSRVAFYWNTGVTSWKQMLFVTSESWWWNAYFVYSEWHSAVSNLPRCSYWYSKSSSEWDTHSLKERDASLKEYAPWIAWTQTDIDVIWSGGWLWLTQIIENIEDNQTLSVSWNVYTWVVYTIVVNSVASWQTYSITLWTWVTNPLNIALPSGSNKKCIITMIATSSTTAIVSWCTMWS